MFLRRVIIAVTLLALSACGDEKRVEALHLDTPDNERIIGTVVSRDYAHELNSQGIQNAAGAAASSGAVSGAQGAAMGAASSQSVNGASAATGMLGSVGSAVTFHMFDTPIDKNGILYTIRKDDGTTFQVSDFPDAGSSIFFPGQRVIVQMNGKYTRLVPLIN